MHSVGRPKGRYAATAVAIVALVLTSGVVGGVSTASQHPFLTTKRPTGDAASTGLPAKGPSLYVNLTASPRVLTLGETTDLSVSVSGGTAPYSYSWSPAPSGCTTPSNVTATMTCKPNETGSFTEVVNVTDSSLPVTRSGSANVTLVVNSPSGGSALLSAGSLFLFAGLIGVVAAAVTAVVIVSYWRRRARRAPIAPVPESPYIPPPGQHPP